MESKDNKEKEEMNIKIQRASVTGKTANKGSCRALAEYINHEDQDRIDAGLEPIPYTTPDGEELTTEEVIAFIDGNNKGLSAKDGKFFHLVVSPSADEIKHMGKDDAEIYQAGMVFVNALSDVYAENFHNEHVHDASDLLLFWKPHFFRGKDGNYQFHIHGIASRQSSGVDGKKVKISPLTNHKNTKEGPVKGGFDRDEFYKKSEKLFDKLFDYERKVAETYEYNNAKVHGTVEEKVEQAVKLVAENAVKIEDDIAAGIARRRRNLKTKHEVEEFARFLEGEGGKLQLPKSKTLSSALDLTELKKDVMSVFETENDSQSLYLALAVKGVSMKNKTSADGLEDLSFEKRGKIVSAKEIMSEKDHKALLSHMRRITGIVPAYVVRARSAVKEAQDTMSQHRRGGPKLKR